MPSQYSLSLSSSLPSHYRFPSSPTRPTSPFFNPNPELDDPARCPAPAVDSSAARTRLEVLSGWEVNFSVLSLYAVSLVSLVYVVLQSLYFASEWRVNNEPLPPSPLEGPVRFILNTASVVVPLYFVASIALAARVTHEQLWTAALLCVGLFTTNPLTRDDIALLQPRRFIVSDAVYATAVYLYLLVSVHSYREFDNRHFRAPRFYAPKLAAAVAYLVLNVGIGLQAHVSLGLVPCSRIITWVILVAGGHMSTRVTLPVVICAIMDFGLAFHIVNEVARTAEFLATVPYVETRAKQLGFRCFVYQTLAFCCNISAIAALIVFILPTSYIYFLSDNSSGFVILEPPVARLGLALIYFTWTLVLAFVNLPPSPLLTHVWRVVTDLVAPLRRTRIAVWLGLADLVATDDAEDSADEDSDAAVSVGRGEMTAAATATSAASSTAVAASSSTSFVIPPKRFVPMRYRHHELFDSVPVSSSGLPSVPPLYLPARALPDIHSSFTSSSADSSFSRVAPSHMVGAPSVENSPRRRLRLRKNLFVMETQVLMVNVAYLSYIFGNPREELPQQTNYSSSASSTSLSVASGTDAARENVLLENDVDNNNNNNDNNNNNNYNNTSNGGGHDLRNTSSNTWEGKELPSGKQPDYDDGTMFRVDPYAMAERYGYTVYKYITCDSLNTHAVVLISKSRVVVGFSGTRDVSNWRTNANINREVLDDRLSRFEFEIPPGNSSLLTDFGGGGGEVDASLDCLDSHDDFGMVSSQATTVGADGTRIKTRLRRSLSEDVVMVSNNSRSDDDEISPLLSLRNSSYGTVAVADGGSGGGGIGDGGGGVSLHRRAASERDSRSRRRHRRHVRRPRVGMSMMASALAHELRTFGQAKVHSGFLDAYMSVRQRVIGALVELYGGRHGNGLAEGLPLFFTGHSLGGAVATFACYEAARYYKRVGIARRQDISCTTFGCPRMGNEAFKMRYDRLVETHWRFEAAADPIPKIPAILNYVPVGVQVLIDQSGMLLVDPSFVEVQWWGRLSNPYLGYRLHVRAAYFMALRMYCKLYRNGTDDLSNRFWPFPVRVQTKGLFRQLHAV